MFISTISMKQRITAFSLPILLLVIFGSASAQQHYWIELSTKDTVGYRPEQHLTAQCLANRLRFGIPTRQYSDIPISHHRTAAITQTGAQLIARSKWLNAVSVVADSAALAAIETLDFVRYVRPISSRIHITRSKAVTAEEWGKAVSFMSPDAFREAGLSGKGITIGVIDAGFYKANTNSSLQTIFKNDRYLGGTDYFIPEREDMFLDKKTDSDTHGTTVLQMIAGKNDEKQKGFAYDASFYLARTDHGDKEYRGEEDLWIMAMEKMDSLGVRLINTSLGYALKHDDLEEDYKTTDMNGETTKITKAANIAAKDKGLFLVVSAGNEGSDPKWRVISAPADSKGVLSIGATDESGLKMGYSSTGPDFLKYMKPDVSAYSRTGTSFSAPIVTGFVACLMQKAPEMPSAQLMEVVRKSSSLYPYGNNYVGYGIPSCKKAIDILNDMAIDKPKTKTVKANKEFVKLKVKAKGLKRGILFDKSSEWHAIDQRKVRGENGKFVVQRLKDVTHSTFIAEGQVYEVVWEW